MYAKASALLAFAASASAHVIMTYPVPYGKDTLTSFPLAPGDFPCKQRAGAFEISEMNQWNAGETKEIAFQGSAVHGGGSCQFSLTTDMEPSTSTQWKVIHSVVGGCPSDAPGNLGNDATMANPTKFPVTMPKDIAAGNYTFAWTWLNKVGNREFYMNCAPVGVGGGSGTASAKDASAALSSLPDMFVANLPATSCTTTEDQDFEYPKPGDSVQKGSKAAPGNSLSGAGCASMTAMGAGKGQMGSPSQETGSPSTPQASEQPAVTSAPVESPAPSATPSNGGGVFAPGASSGAAANPTSVAAPVPTSAAAPAPPASTGGSSPSSGDCTACQQDGAVVCIGSTQFGLCNRGCAVAQDLAAGMTCANGSITRRSVRFPRAHLHRRHGSQLI